MKSISEKLYICSSSALEEKQSRNIMINYNGEATAALLLRFHGTVYAYCNRCVHMAERLDEQGACIFDRSGETLQCSLHGIIYQPESGAALSAMCHGQRLIPIKVCEADGAIWFDDAAVEAVDQTG